MTASLGSIVSNHKMAQFNYDEYRIALPHGLDFFITISRPLWGSSSKYIENSKLFPMSKCFTVVFFSVFYLRDPLPVPSSLLFEPKSSDTAV